MVKDNSTESQNELLVNFFQISMESYQHPHEILGQIID